MTDRMDQQEDGGAGGGNENLDAELQQELEQALGGQSIEDILAAEEGTSARGTPGSAPQVRRGQVVSIQGGDIFVQMGGKSEGVLPVAQFEDQPLPAIGEIIEVTIEGYDSSEGLLQLSRLGAIQAATWETLREGEVVEGRVTAMNTGGLELSINGIRAFMPVSQIDTARVENMAPYLSQRLQCKVLEVERREQNVIVSRRALLEEQTAEARQKLLATLEAGQTVVGTVRTIMPYGAFVDIGGLDGLLHVRDMSHARVEDPHHIVQEGQQIEVKVLNIDREAGKIALGLKQTLPDPWLDAEVNYPVGDVVSGRITHLADFGAFVELEPGVEGLIPISELTFQGRVQKVGDFVKPNEVVRVRVMNVDLPRRRISLSLKRVGEDPWTGASVRWPVGIIVDGIVKRSADFGAFVELTPGVEGLVHISELSAERVRSVQEAVSEGQAVQVKVLSVDEEARRISLSMKQAATEMPQPEQAAAQESTAASQKKRKKPLRGGLETGGLGDLKARFGIADEPPKEPGQNIE